MVRSVLRGQKEGNECLLGSWMDLLSRIWVVVGSLNCWKQIYSKTGLFCCKIPISWDVTSMEDRIIYCVVDSISLHRRTAYCIECHNKGISKWQGWPDPPIKFNLGSIDLGPENHQSGENNKIKVKRWQTTLNLNQYMFIFVSKIFSEIQSSLLLDVATWSISRSGAEVRLPTCELDFNQLRGHTHHHNPNSNLVAICVYFVPCAGKTVSEISQYVQYVFSSLITAWVEISSSPCHHPRSCWF